MRIATIDIGTNTILLLICDVIKKESAYSLNTILQKQYIPRIGRNTDSSREINKQAFMDCKNILLEYKVLAHNYTCQNIIACGTSVLRDAINKYEFVEFQNKETGININILSGSEEAEFTFLGALSNMKDNNNYTVIDIGGGSTEISFGKINDLQFHKSINIGAVRVTERFFKNLPPSKIDLQNAINFIQSEIKDLSVTIFNNSKIIATAGTATTLAKYDQNLVEFNFELIENYNLKPSSIKKLVDNLKNLSLSEIQKIKSINIQRSDIILAGALILQEIAKFFAIENIYVSTKGLRYGIALNVAKKTIF
ncbi:MAG: Ppx/GppA family phosphatase [Bacteroidetes bacterium]|nr:Ppx/GppA family phosphatase [Bacteroidota bacterium]